MLERIKALCCERGITISQLERETGIGNGTISRWGESSPRVDKAKAVAEFFGVTLDSLVSGTDPDPTT